MSRQTTAIFPQRTPCRIRRRMARQRRSGLPLPGWGRQKAAGPRFLGQNVAAARFQQLGSPRQGRGRPCGAGPAAAAAARPPRPRFCGQLAQLRRHLLGPGEQAQVPGPQGGAVVAEGHRHGGQAPAGPQQPLFGGVEGIELVDEDRPVPQKLRQSRPGPARLPAGLRPAPAGRRGPCRCRPAASRSPER